MKLKAVLFQEMQSLLEKEQNRLRKLIEENTGMPPFRAEQAEKPIEEFMPRGVGMPRKYRGSILSTNRFLVGHMKDGLSFDQRMLRKKELYDNEAFRIQIKELEDEVELLDKELDRRFTKVTSFVFDVLEGQRVRLNSGVNGALLSVASCLVGAFIATQANSTEQVLYGFLALTSLIGGLSLTLPVMPDLVSYVRAVRDHRGQLKDLKSISGS